MPASINKYLRSYQRDGIRFLFRCAGLHQASLPLWQWFLCMADVRSYQQTASASCSGAHQANFGIWLLRMADVRSHQRAAVFARRGWSG